MKKLIIILLFIITSGIFSRTNDVFLHEFGISDKSIEYYNKALNIKSMNGENSEIRSAYRDAVKEDGRNYLALDELGFKPLITAGLRLGEGTGAVCAWPLLDMALAVYNEMSTFTEIGIDAYQPLGGK